MCQRGRNVEGENIAETSDRDWSRHRPTHRPLKTPSSTLTFRGRPWLLTSFLIPFDPQSVRQVRQVPFRKPLLQGDRFRQWSFVKNTTRVTEVSSFLTVVSSVKKPATVEIQDGLRIANREQEFHTRFQNQTQLVLPSELWRLLPQLCTYVFRPHFFFFFF